MNFSIQHYKGIPIRLIDRNYKNRKAMRFTLNNTNQNVWIPKKHLKSCGTVKPNEDIDYVFDKASRQLELAGLRKAWIPIDIKELI